MNIFAGLSCLLAIAWQPVAAAETASQRIPAAPVSPASLDSPIVIGEFVPPEPPQPKVVPAMQVESTVTGEVDGKRITVLRGAPSTLPDIPSPVAEAPLAQEEAASRQVLVTDEPEPVTLQVGATVYDHRVSVVHWRNPGHPETGYEAVVGLDFALFANVTNFTHKEVPHQLLLMYSDVPTEQGEDSFEIPQVETGSYRVTQGNPGDAAGMAPFTALMDLYAAEKAQLLAAHVARQKYFADAEAYRKAHPPVEPAQHTFWLRPHRGSRYLQAEGGDR